MKPTTVVLSARVPPARLAVLSTFATASGRTLSDAIRFFAVLGCGGSAADAEGVNAEIGAMAARAVAWVKERGGEARTVERAEAPTTHVHVRVTPAWGRVIKDRGGLGKAIVRGLEASGRRA